MMEDVEGREVMVGELGGDCRGDGGDGNDVKRFVVLKIRWVDPMTSRAGEDWNSSINAQFNAVAGEVDDRNQRTCVVFGLC